MNRLVTTSLILTIVTSLGTARVLRQTETDDHPRYAYKYSINDPVTRDIKEHWEARDGDYVRGSYSLLEPNGKVRVVDYWADGGGFNADVKRLGEDAPPPPDIEPLPAVPLAEIPVTELSEYEANDAAAVNDGNDAAPPVPVETLKPLAPADKYGFGAGGDAAPLGRLYANVESGSHRWDPTTGSYGGWVPLAPPVKKYATIFSKKYVDGKLHKWAIGPISLVGRTLVFKVKH